MICFCACTGLSAALYFSHTAVRVGYLLVYEYGTLLPGFYRMLLLIILLGQNHHTLLPFPKV